MGTRGAFGFRHGGVDKITYNHFDSYPDCLGSRVVDDLNAALVEDAFGEMRLRVDALRLVGRDDAPTADDVAHCEAAGLADYSVGTRGEIDWYKLLRNGQPTNGIWPLLRAGVMIGNVEFLRDSLFCEYAYIVNLDDMTFEVYRGFQKSAHEAGRYADLPPLTNSVSTYWPVALVGTFPIADIAQWKDTWAETCFPSDEDEDA